MKIRVFAIGKIKEKYLKDGIEEYLTRIKPYSQIENIEVSDEPIVDNPKPADIKKAIDKEGMKAFGIFRPSA